MRPDQALAARLVSWPDPFFAVIDGGGFADVRQVLQQADLPARSLFLEQRASVVVTAGPFLVPMDGRRLKRLLAIPGIEAACVFWASPASEPEVFRHLRSINLACIPRPADAPPDPFAPAVESVLFRHWDPSVLSIVLPILEAAQRARLFGPMQRLVLFVPGQDDAPDEARQAVARPDWPPPPRGFLHFSPAQIDAIQSAMAARSHGRIARYLRDTAPDHTSGLDDAALRAVVTASEAEARHWGLRTEAGFGRFAWLMLVTRGGFARMEPARAYVTQGDAQPDRKLRMLMAAVPAHLHAAGAPA